MIVVSILDERAKGLALGAAEDLVKPVGRDDLLRALATVSVIEPAMTREDPSSADTTP